MTTNGLPVRPIRLLLLLAALCCAPLSARSGVEFPPDHKGVDSGDYNIQQTVEFGYRANWVNGNQDTYDTFVNLGSGVRLFNYTLEMRSLDHNGLLFDNLSFSNFGYGGDPNDVSRLHIDKNKWYDFQLLFRRDKNFWDYNLFANPLNPASSKPAIAHHKFAQRAGPCAPHAGLQPDASSAIARALPAGLFAQCERRPGA